MPRGIEIYRSLSDLVYGVEAIDVRNGEYACFASDGQAINLIVVPSHRHPHVIELASVTAEIVDASESQAKFINIMRKYLKCLSDRHGLELPVKNLENMSLSELAALVPDRFVESS